MMIGNSLNLVTLNLQKSLDKLSGSEKLDDNSNLTIHDNLESSISSHSAEIKNFNNAVGFMQIADGTLNSLSKESDKLQELSIASGNGALNSDQLSMIKSQMSDIKSTMGDMVNNSSYNGLNVFHSGAFSDEVNLSINSDSIDIDDIDSIKKFQSNINSTRSGIGSFMNESTSKIDNLSSAIVNETNSKSNYEVDYAEEVNKFKNNSLKLDASLIANAHKTDLLKNSMSELLA